MMRRAWEVCGGFFYGKGVHAPSGEVPPAPISLSLNMPRTSDFASGS